MNKEEFVVKVKELGLELNDKQIKQFADYANFLIEYNKHTNITAITDLESIYLKHFYDSLTIIKQDMVDISNVNNLIDIGTGGGFPGMVLKIAYPSIDVTLLDSNNKKTKFLEELSKVLELDVNIINDRSEEYALNHLETYDLVVSRAVANLRVLTELCLPLVKVNGYFISLKGNIEEELKEAESIITKLNGKVINIINLLLPGEEAVRNNVYIKKMDKTPKGYPRNYCKIKKGN